MPEINDSDQLSHNMEDNEKVKRIPKIRDWFLMSWYFTRFGV